MKKKLIIVDENDQDAERLSMLLRENGFSTAEIVENFDGPESLLRNHAQMYLDLFENAPIGIFHRLGQVVGAKRFGQDMFLPARFRADKPRRSFHPRSPRCKRRSRLRRTSSSVTSLKV